MQNLFISAGDLAEGGCYGLDVEIVIAWLLENPPASIEGTDSMSIWKPNAVFINLCSGLESSASEDEEDLDEFTMIENDLFLRTEHLIDEDVLDMFGNNNKTSSSSDSDSTEEEDSDDASLIGMHWNAQQSADR